jgi:hypothetical protein
VLKRTVSIVAAESQPHLVWNAFIDLLAVEHYEDLSATQRKAHLVFWYDSEVQNGGHGQYLENQGTRRLSETISALHELGLSCQGHVLEDVAKAFAASAEGVAWETVLGGDAIQEFDAAFHACTPDVDRALQRHLGLHREEYVSLV